MSAELDDLLSKQQAYEEKNAEELQPMVDQAANSVLKMFLGQIMLDSKKHAFILQAIQDLRTGQVIWHIDKQRMKEQLAHHLKVEEQMLKSMQILYSKLTGEKISSLLKEILTDEQRHHKVLTLLIDIIESLDVNQEQWIDLFIQFQQEDFGRT